MRDRIDQTYQQGLSILQFDFEVIRPMRIERVGSFLVENIWKVMVFFQNSGEVDGCIGDFRMGLCGHLRKGKLEDFSTIHPADASK